MRQCWLWIGLPLAACLACGGTTEDVQPGTARPDAESDAAHSPDAQGSEDTDEFALAPAPEAPPGADPLAVFDVSDVGAARVFRDLLTSLFTVPETAAEADAAEAAARAAEAALAADPNGYSDLLLPICAGADEEEQSIQFGCMALLTHFETGGTISFLREAASKTMVDLVAQLQGAVPDNPPLSGREFAALQATDALAARARTGSSAAVDALVDVCAVGDPAVVPRALAALYSALPRHVVKARLRPLLAPGLQYLLYSVH